MSFPGTSQLTTTVSDIVATTIEKRSGKIADNVTKNNAVLAWLKKAGKIKTVSGGSQIFEELSFAENANGAPYSGYDLLPVAAQDVISAATYTLKQYAVPVVISGLEELQNSGKEAVIDLLESRIGVAEATMANLLSQGIYSDGTGSGGKQIVGLKAMAPATATASQTDTYAGISRSTWSFWRSQYTLSKSGAAPSAAELLTAMNTHWAKSVRGKDRINLILADNNYWGLYVASLQNVLRVQVSDQNGADLGFPSVKFFDADVVLDGGIGGFMPTDTTALGPGSPAAGDGVMYTLNTDYCFWRPHKDRNMVPLSPQRRVSINQDATVEILAWAGAFTCSGAQFQGIIVNT